MVTLTAKRNPIKRRRLRDGSRTFIAGASGYGKTTLLKTLVTGFSRVLIWDWEHEYSGEVVTLEDVARLGEKKAFRAVYRPGSENLFREFQAFAHVVLHCCLDMAVVIDEAALVCKGRDSEGGLGLLMRLSRKRGLDVFVATQRPTGLPGIVISEARSFHIFHLHNPADIQALASKMPPDQLARIPSLGVHESITFHV